jgi:DNA-binding NarL/FixJ family response regulator
VTPTISIVIADDHPLFRKGVRQSIEEDPSMRIVGEASDGAAALQLIEEHMPDVAVLDIDMPGMRGLKVARMVQEKRLFVAVIILTIYKEGDMFNEAMDAGVRGYVMKETAAIDLLEAIKTVALGQYYLSPAIAGHLVRRSQSAKHLLTENPNVASLTPAEVRILKAIALNKTSKEIADEFCISFHTVETHRSNIAAKLKIHGSHSLLKFALENRGVLSSLPSLHFATPEFPLENTDRL